MQNKFKSLFSFCGNSEKRQWMMNWRSTRTSLISTFSIGLQVANDDFLSICFSIWAPITSSFVERKIVNSNNCVNSREVVWNYILSNIELNSSLIINFHYFSLIKSFLILKLRKIEFFSSIVADDISNLVSKFFLK